MEHLGRHVIVELWGCNEGINDPQVVESAIREAVVAAKATLLNLYVHAFEPQGVTGVAVLSESHLSVHSWPEYKYIAADVFTCGSTDPHAAAEVLRQVFKPSSMEVHEMIRGIAPVRKGNRPRSPSVRKLPTLAIR